METSTIDWTMTTWCYYI